MQILPFSYPWIFRKLLHRSKNILDIGCGDGQTGATINCDGIYCLTGVDIYEPDIARINKSRFYSRGIVADLTKLSPSTFSHERYDAVISSQVVEHLEKKEALMLISNIEKIPAKLIIIATTNGFIPFQPLDGEPDPNPYQIHKCGWSVEEFESMGYTVVGQAMNAFWTPPHGVLHRVRSPLLKQIFIVVAYLLSPLAYIFPRQATYLIAYKHIGS